MTTEQTYMRVELTFYSKEHAQACADYFGAHGIEWNRWDSSFNRDGSPRVINVDFNVPLPPESA